jgi:hypothetical protein
MNNKLKLEVDAATARLVLAQMEQQVEDKRLVRDGLEAEIDALENGCKELREQMNNSGPESGRQPRGDNRARIKEYLSKIPGNKGARASEITKHTGIGVSSTAFTLKHYDDFVRDEETKRWRLKTM